MSKFELNKEDKEFLKNNTNSIREFDNFLDNNFELHSRVGLLKSVLSASEYAFNYETATYIKEFRKFIEDKETCIKQNKNNDNDNSNEENCKEEELESE